MNIFALGLAFGVFATAGLAVLVSAVLVWKRVWKALAWSSVIFILLIGGEFGMMALWMNSLDHRLHRPVLDEEAVGEWVLDSNSLAVAARDGFMPYHPVMGARHYINLRPDHTCEYSSIVDYPPQFAKAEGTWEIRPDSRSKDVSELNLALDINKGGYGFALEFGQFDNKLGIWTYWGDPDSDELMIYRKQPNQPLQPTSFSVTHPADAGCAPEKAVAEH